MRRARAGSHASGSAWIPPAATLAVAIVWGLIALASETAKETPVPARAKDIEGADPKVAALAAHRLLQDLATSSGSDAELRALKGYVSAKLDPKVLSGPTADAVAAERIADAMATWITASGPPLPETPELLLPLVGIGPPGLRDSVVRALQALLRHELSQAADSPTLKALLERLSRDPSRSAAFVRDASRVVWEVDGKALIEVLVATVGSANGGPVPIPVLRASLEELRARIPRDFPNPEGWQKWWKENRDQPLSAILSACWARSREELVAAWRQAVRRLRETENADRLLAVLQETLASSYTPELRVATVLALGDFADWIAEMRFEGSGEAPEAAREKLLRRAVQLLLPIPAVPEKAEVGFYVERGEVSQAALASLSKYRALFEKDPELFAEASRIVFARLGGLDERHESRGELIETLRLAGALRLEAARDLVTSLISRFLEPFDDVEVLTAAVTALGRLSEKGGIAQADWELLMRCFRASEGDRSNAKGRELRRACVAALGSGSANEEVRSKLLSFHRELLAGGGSDGDLRIPAILALGTLARQGTNGALEALFQVLDKQGEFQPAEVIAAIDSIAYVGGEPALSGFLSRAAAASREKRIQDHLLRKTATLVTSGGVGMLAVAVEKLEGLTLSEDNLLYAEFASALLQDVQVQGMVAASQQGAGEDGRLGLLWHSLAVAARLEDLLGKEKEVTARLGAIEEISKKAKGLAEKYAADAQGIADLQRSIQARTALREAFEKEDARIPELLEGAKKLVETASSPAVRWSNLRWVLRRLEAWPASAAAESFREGWYQLLASESAQDLWKGLPAQYRERYFARLGALKQRPKSPSGPSS